MAWVDPSNAQVKEKLSMEHLLDLLKIAVDEVHDASAGSSSQPPPPPLTRRDSTVKELSRVLDQLFLHRLSQPQKGYWPAVSEFLPKADVAEIQRVWEPKSTRANSLAWLFQSLAEGTLAWQVLNFRSGRRLLRRYYRIGAFMLDEKFLELGSIYLEGLQDVVFSFEQPSDAETTVSEAVANRLFVGRRDDCERFIEVPSARLDAAFSRAASWSGEQRVPVAAVAAPPEAAHDAIAFDFAAPSSSARLRPSALVVRRKKRRPAVAQSASLRRAVTFANDCGGPHASTPLGSLQTNTYTFDDLFVRPAPSFSSDDETPVAPSTAETACQSQAVMDAPPRPQFGLEVDDSAAAAPFRWAVESDKLPPPPVEDAATFESQLRRRMNAVSDRLSNLSDSTELYSRDDEEPSFSQTTVTEADTHLLEGELLLESGEVVQLGVQVFAKEGERFYKIFRVWLSFNQGQPLTRWCLITNFAVYLLTQCLNTTVDVECESAALVHSSDRRDLYNFTRFEAETVIPFKRLEFVSVGLCGQLFSIHQTDRRSVVTVCTGSDQHTKAILLSLEVAVRRSGLTGVQPPSVLTDATPQRIVLQRWAANETNVPRESVELLEYALVFWRAESFADDDATDGATTTAARTGYLFSREFYPASWIWRASEWISSYFILRGRKLYQFTDSTCRVGLRVIDLREEVVGCRECAAKEQSYCVELLLARADLTLQLGCQTRHDSEQWLRAVTQTLSQGSVVDEVETAAAPSCFALLTDTHLLLGQESMARGFVRTLAAGALADAGRVEKRAFDDHFVLSLDWASGEHAGFKWTLAFRAEEPLTRVLKALRGLSVLISEPTSPCFDDSLGGADVTLELADCWRGCRQF